VIIGFALTGTILDGNMFTPFPFVVSCLVIFYMAFLLRLKNDFQDFDKDSIAFPERALPRGVLSKKEAEHAIHYLQYGLFGYFAVILIFYPAFTRLMLLLTGGYLWLILHNFYAEKWLTRHPLINGVMQQGIIFPLTLLVISLGRPEYVFSLQGFSYALLLSGAFFTFDICRKLDPYSHPITLAYIHYYGFRVTYWLVVVLLGLSALGSYGFGVHLILWTCEVGVLVMLTMLFKTPRIFRAVETAAGLSLIAHAWAGVLQ